MRAYHSMNAMCKCRFTIDIVNNVSKLALLLHKCYNMNTLLLYYSIVLLHSNIVFQKCIETFFFQIYLVEYYDVETDTLLTYFNVPIIWLVRFWNEESFLNHP